jgi:S-formylglutathione hydrolase FrmB
MSCQTTPDFGTGESGILGKQLIQTRGFYSVEQPIPEGWDMRHVIGRLGLVISLLVLSLFQSVLAQGTLEKIRVEGNALAGNLEGDDHVRDVYVYLPPGYAGSQKRYPVLYFLHGYGATAQTYVERVLNLPAGADEAIARGSQEMIVVVPDAYTLYNGSMYGNSPTIGNWEAFIARDLVSYIDNHYRTLTNRENRGLSGHSMGGYGTLRIGMKYPDTYNALYAMSSCCLLNQAPSLDAVNEQIARMSAGSVKGARGFDNVLQAQAAAFAPNPQNPPWYFDWPFENGDLRPEIAGKWTANSPLLLVDQYVPALKSFSGLFLDVGDEDSLAGSNQSLAASLTRLGVPYGWELYQGTHGNRIGQRFIDNVMPFFTTHLQQ